MDINNLTYLLPSQLSLKFFLGKIGKVHEKYWNLYTGMGIRCAKAIFAHPIKATHNQKKNSAKNFCDALKEKNPLSKNFSHT